MAEPSSKRARTDAPVENPYLAHLNNPADRMTGGANGGKGGFEGWIPRKQGGKEVEAVMVRLVLFVLLSGSLRRLLVLWRSGGILVN